MAMKNARAIGSTTFTTCYTVPSSTVSIIIGFQVANVDTVNHNIRVQWLDSSNSNAATRLLYDVSVPAGASLSCIEGKLILEAADCIQVYCDTNNKCEFTLSVVEMAV
jgi:hypothetical protein